LGAAQIRVVLVGHHETVQVSAGIRLDQDIIGQIVSKAGGGRTARGFDPDDFTVATQVNPKKIPISED
jgi:hypothetical protein